MNVLIKKIKLLEKSLVKKKVDARLKEFESFKNKKNDKWFSELCFCLLTANSKARTAMQIQKELGSVGFSKCSIEDVRGCIIKNKHRFHNNKAKFIVGARQHINIKDKITKIAEVKSNNKITKASGESLAREWLVKNIKGLGYKESSHFLRNVGYKNLAILDRHILNLMVENNYLKEKPKSLNKKNYLEIEKTFSEIAKQLNMSPAELDLYMWYMKGGDVLK